MYVRSFKIVLVFLAFITITGISGCRPVMERSDCGLSEREAEMRLGAKVRFLDKSDPLLNLSPAEKSDPKIKACGYQTDDNSFLYLQQNEYASEQEAKQYYDFAKDFMINMEKRNAGDYWEDDILAISPDAYMVHAYHEDGLHVDVAARVGKNAFTIRSNGSRTNKVFSHVMIKGLAVTIGRQFADRK